MVIHKINDLIEKLLNFSIFSLVDQLTKFQSVRSWAEVSPVPVPQSQWFGRCDKSFWGNPLQDVGHWKENKRDEFA